MAKTAKPKKDIPMEEALWKSADKLRGSVEPAEYKHVVLSLFFLKFASDKFVECRKKIIASYGEKYAEMKPFYAQKEYMSLLKYIYRMAACQNQQFRCSYCRGFVKGRVLPTKHCCCIVSELVESLYRLGLSF